MNAPVLIDEATCLDWHGPVFVATLARFESDRAPHALLVTGPPGIGKAAFALTLARHVLGRGGRLPSDLEATPDFRRVAPDEPGKAIVVDQVRALSEFIALTSAGGGYKFVLVDPADALNTNAANALLKTLEEPPPRSTLVLVTARPSLLLPTIRSRCQVIALSAPEPAAARAWLEARSGAPDAVGAALAVRRGSPGGAAALIDAELSGQIPPAVAAINALLKGAGGVVQQAGTLVKLEPALVFELAALALEALIRGAHSIDESDSSDAKLIHDLTDGVHGIHLNEAFAAYDRVLDGRDLIARGSPVRPLDLLEDTCEALARTTRRRGG